MGWTFETRTEGKWDGSRRSIVSIGSCVYGAEPDGRTPT